MQAPCLPQQQNDAIVPSAFYLNFQIRRSFAQTPKSPGWRLADHRANQPDARLSPIDYRGD
jgi:hypothetical protein